MLKEMKFTRKKLTVIPRETESERNLQLYDEYVDTMSNLDPLSLHFFDESSVVKTTGNRSYGHAPSNQRAVELQRYASNANYTINLLHGPLGINYFNLLEGPSNGQHLVNFFLEAIQETDENGQFVLKRGDTVIMDNCGFHHARITEAHLRHILGNVGISLIFQPPYRPELNTCEHCFNLMKCYLKKHQNYAEEYTDQAVCDAASMTINARVSLSFFKKCGYL